MSGRRGKGDGKAQVISFTSTDGDDDTDLSAIIGKALGLQTRPPGAKSALELRAEYGVSRSVMQKTLKQLCESGVLDKRRIIERDSNGKAQINVVYFKVQDLGGDDGFGNFGGNCGTCGRKLDVVRPGKFQCPKCG
jgi:hypothetical protein